MVGLAGPDRLDGPPSLDPTYTLKGAKSIVSMVLPMDQGAINDYLGKKSAVPHNVDQLKENQRMFRVSEMVAGYIRSLGLERRGRSTQQLVPPHALRLCHHPDLFPSFRSDGSGGLRARAGPGM